MLGWFHQLSRTRVLREFGGFGAITWAEIDAWARLLRINPTRWEINALLRLDLLWLNVMAEKGHPFEDGDDDDTAPSKQKQLSAPAGSPLQRRRP